LGTPFATQVALAAMAAAGCRERRERLVIERGYGPEPGYVVVREGPPALIVERRPPPPGPGHLWIDGCWDWNGRGYVWQHGRWTLPPQPHTVWVGPRYERFDRDYRYTPGHWGAEQRERAEEHHERH